MRKYLFKLELRTAWIYYFFMFLFIILWGIFLFTGAFTFNFLSKLKSHYKKGVYLTVILYPQDQKEVNIFVESLNSLDLIKKIEVLSPNNIYNETKTFLPKSLKKLVKKKELISAFPYVIKIFPTTIRDYSNIIKTLTVLKTSQDFELIKSRNFKLYKFIEKLELFIAILILACFLFYIWFLSFLIYTLKIKLSSQHQLFLLLGGSKKALKFTRVSISFMVTSIAFIIVSLLSSWVVSKISLFLPIGWGFNFGSLLKTSLELSAVCEIILIMIISWKG